VVDSAELDGVVVELEADSTDPNNWDATAVSEGDSKVQVGDAAICNEVGTTVPKIAGSAGINAAIFNSSRV
jgi:hypothetical protein